MERYPAGHPGRAAEFAAPAAFPVVDGAIAWAPFAALVLRERRRALRAANPPRDE